MNYETGAEVLFMMAEKILTEPRAGTSCMQDLAPGTRCVLIPCLDEPLPFPPLCHHRSDGGQAGERERTDGRLGLVMRLLVPVQAVSASAAKLKTDPPAAAETRKIGCSAAAFLISISLSFQPVSPVSPGIFSHPNPLSHEFLNA